MLGLPKCKGCEERGEKIAAVANALLDWARNPVKRDAPPLHLIHDLTRPDSKKEQGS